MTEKQPGYVYLFRNEFNYTKIGHATNPKRRAKTIQYSSGVTIVESYISPICFDHAEIEFALKEQFAPYRKKGEWFDIELNVIKEALNSYFPESATPAIKPIIAIANHAISENQDEPTVNARELHTFLESKQQFADWIKRRIEEYGFTQGVDFTASQNYEALETSTYGQGKIDYFITIDMAKELSMVERTAKGKEARQYFIACEKALRQGKSTVVDSDLRSVVYAIVAQALTENTKKPAQPVVNTKIVELPDDFVQFMDHALSGKDILEIRASHFYQDYLKVATEHASKTRFGRSVKAYCKQRGFNLKHLFLKKPLGKTTLFYSISHFTRGVK